MNADEAVDAARATVTPAELHFTDLISPVDPHEFFARYWERGVLYVPSRGERRMRSLIGLADVDHLLASLPESAMIKVAQAGTHASPSRQVPGGVWKLPSVYESFATGHTVIVDGLHAFWPPVRDLCRNLVGDVGMQVQANLYATPASAAGFPCHWDGHDVLILQLEGNKLWSLHDRDAPLPRPSSDGGSCDDHGDGQAHEVTLGPDDLLYIPRGTRHQARTSTQPSVHLTVGLIAPTWEDLLVAGVESLVASRPDLRRSLPPGWFRQGQLHWPGGREYPNLVESLCSERHLAGALDLLASQVVKTTPCAPDGHFRQLAFLKDVSVTSRLRRRSGVSLFASQLGDEAKLAFPGNTVRGPTKLFWAFQYVADTEEFVVRDIPGWYSDEERVTVAKALVQAGCLQAICPPPSGNGAGP